MRARALVAALALVAGACRGGSRAPSPEPPSFTEVAAQVKPAVVNVSAKQMLDPGDPEALLGPQPPAAGPEFLPLPGTKEPIPRQSLGSGFFVSPDGLVLTNHHVIASAREIMVRLPGRDPKRGDELPARVVGSDVQTDLALLRIDGGPRPLPHLRLGESEQVRVGDWVIAVGSPFGLEQSVTAGIVSATGRAIGTGQDDFIQTDAPINPGSSGGPLLNLDGEVVGVNNVILSQTGGNVGISFATPTSIISPVLEELRTRGYVVRGWLGVSGQEITPELAEGLQLPGRGGALISNVLPDGPAAQAGIRPGDVIVSFRGQPVEAARELAPRVARAVPGEQVEVGLLRNGRRETLRLRVEEAPRDEPSAPAVSERAAEIDFGLIVERLTPRVAEELGLEPGPGILVRDVLPGRLGEEAGMMPGDVILEVNGRDVDTIEELRGEVVRSPKEKSVVFFVRRDGETLFLAVRKS